MKDFVMVEFREENLFEYIIIVNTSCVVKEMILSKV